MKARKLWILVMVTLLLAGCGNTSTVQSGSEEDTEKEKIAVSKEAEYWYCLW